jgi:putative Holliday junction resolvase
VADPPDNDQLTLLAIDFGERRIGLAAATIATGTSSALKTLPARGGVPDWQALDKAISDWAPDILVVGLPYNMDGTESTMTARVLEFIDQLAHRYRLPVETADERLTSVEAKALLKEQRQQGIRTKKLKPEDVDSLAAKFIADNWMNMPGRDGKQIK